MSHSPLVSVIMNCYNGEIYLKEAINSVYNQDYQNFEIIFWDNNSSDHSKKIANDFDERVKYFCSPITTGLGEARNLALRKATGEYICFLDTDDYYEENKFSIQTSLMSKSKLVMSYSSSRFFSENKTIWIRKAKNATGNIFNNLLRDYEINMNTVMLDRKLFFDENYSFNPNLQYSPDYNLFMKIALKNDVGVIKEVLGNSRVHKNSLTKKLLHLIPKEHSFTLNEINDLYPGIFNKYKKNFLFCNKKIKYYEAIAHIADNQFSKSRKILKKIFYADLKFFALYILTLLPIKGQKIIKILKR